MICTGQIIFPGDAIIAHDDGICVTRKDVPTPRQVDDEHIVNWDAKRVKLAAGKLGINIYNMLPDLAKARFHYVKTLDYFCEFNGIDCRNRD